MRTVQNLCCWGTDYCKCQIIGLTRNQNIKLTYIILILLLLFVTTIVSKYKSESEALIAQFSCQSSFTDVANCVKENLAFRWLLSLAFMHFLLTIIVSLRSHTSKIFNEGVWLIKLVLVIGFGFMFMYLVPQGLIKTLQAASVYMIPIWYLIQSVIIIDMIYTLDGTLRHTAQNHNKVHLIIALLSILSVIGAVIINVLSYTNFKDSDERLYIAILNSIQIGVYLIVAMAKVVKGNSLLIYGIVMVYSNAFGYYLRYPVEQLPNTSFPILQIALVAIALLSILSPGSNKVRTKKSSLNEILAVNTSKEEEDNRYVSSNKWITFHFIFFITCLMLTFVVYQSNSSFITPNQSSKSWPHTIQILRIIGWYMIIVVYFWTLVTGKLYPDQDFDQLQNYFKEFELN